MLPEKGWHDQLKYCCEKAIHVVVISFAAVFEVLDSFFVLMILAD